MTQRTLAAPAVYAIPRARRRVFAWWPSNASDGADLEKGFTTGDCSAVKVSVVSYQ